MTKRSNESDGTGETLDNKIQNTNSNNVTSQESSSNFSQKKNVNKKVTSQSKDGSTQHQSGKSVSLIYGNRGPFLSKNLSTRTIATKYLNSKIVSGSYASVREETLYLNLTLKVFTDRLNAQANVWARKIYSLHEVNLRYIIGSRDDFWISKLEECFTYSYFSAVLYGISSSRVGDFSNNKCFVKGHYLLHRYLVSRSFSFQFDEQTIVYDFRISKERYDEIIKLAKSYSYINDYLVEFPTFSLENQSLDRILKGLKEKLSLDDPSLISSSDFNIVEDCLTKDNFPIGNSFYTDDKDPKYWSYAFTSDSNIIDKTTLFGKACFLSLYKPNDISGFYDKFEEDDKFSLIKYEVTSICGSQYPAYVKS